MITWRKLGSLSTLYLPEVTGRELDVLMDQHVHRPRHGIKRGAYKA